MLSSDIFAVGFLQIADKIELIFRASSPDLSRLCSFILKYLFSGFMENIREIWSCILGGLAFFTGLTVDPWTGPLLLMICKSLFYLLLQFTALRYLFRMLVVKIILLTIVDRAQIEII